MLRRIPLIWEVIQISSEHQVIEAAKIPVMCCEFKTRVE
jgi:hypothetical protein